MLLIFCLALLENERELPLLELLEWDDQDEEEEAEEDLDEDDLPFATSAPST